MSIQKARIFEVFQLKQGSRKSLLTKNAYKGNTVYGERVRIEGNDEYREWDAFKSKLCATIHKGSPNIGIRKDDVVLYLGCATGTTVSHVSDIVGKKGLIFAVDIAPKVMRNMIFVAEKRDNIVPILADANNTKELAPRISAVDVLFQDIAQKNQLSIFLKNVDLFLKPGGYALLAVKARSIDVTRKPKKIFNEVKAELEKNLEIIDQRTLEPFQLDHCMFICMQK